MHKMFRFVQKILFVASEERSDLFLLSFLWVTLRCFVCFYNFTLYAILLSSGNSSICDFVRFNVHHQVLNT